jgi:sigma-B regulation protein RsbU (phosphoserine phosphatase)
VARWRPARLVAGDFYDFLEADGGRLGLVIADVSDKGPPAALFMALTRSIVRASAPHSPSAAEGIARANRLICADSTGGMFVTLFYALLDPETGEITYVNAGHNPPLLYRRGLEVPTPLVRTGMALGVLEDAPFQQVALQLEPGDCLLLYTDGVTDAVDDAGQAFGLVRLERLVAERRNESAARIVAALERALDDFTGAVAPFDDVTIIAIKRL